MARAKWCGDQIYDAGAIFKERCLREDGSLFTPGASIWTAQNLRLVEERVGIEDLGEGSFISKLEAQFDGLPAEAIQLGAELLYVLLLPEADTGTAKKHEHIVAILDMLPEVQLPRELDLALDFGGVASFAAAKAYRDAYMRFLARLSVRVKETPLPDRERILDDPWAFREVVEEVGTSTDRMMAHAILHLLFPETFEYMISDGHRDKLITTFAAAPGVADAPDVDRKIARIRELAAMGGDPDMDLYDDVFARVWKDAPTEQWQEATRWAVRLRNDIDFDVVERAYKLKIAAKVAAAREALSAGEPDWLDKLRTAFGGGNNLTSWRAHDTLLDWAGENEREAADVLRVIWSGEEDALRAFLEALPKDAVAGQGTRTSIASYLLLGVDETRFPFYKVTPYQALRRALGLGSESDPFAIDPENVYRPAELATRLGLDGRRVRAFLRETFPRSDSEEGSTWYLTPDQADAVLEEFGGDIDVGSPEAAYADWTGLLDELRLRLLAAGHPIRDVLDAQGIAWWLVACPVPEDWSDEDRAAFEAFRGGGSVVPPPDDGGTIVPKPTEGTLLPPPSSKLASGLFMPLSWLERMYGLLNEKRQLILYGPPGTGKTFVAQHVGQHIAEHGGSVRLVQFHPSYTYEDFFEGYRPQHHDGGTLSFELVPGTLREIAREAEENPTKPHVLIIDEINRGNIAKIFGELYFLLEYRDASIQLQYSRDEQFKLPENLFVIGTMNTADRSIALVDTALRRRFYFLGLIPTREPVAKVLEQWLASHGLAPEPAALLQELNQAIADEEFSIGPSYFMTRDGSAPDLERVWDHAILPLLEERFYGTGRDLEGEFGLNAIRKKVAAAADATGEEPDDDGAAPSVV